ncbi:S8 family peptidase [Aureispira anguillae]|uniref:S8 family peptidase n=1 Tax=Aureispira anguillae TaxID=2864201 RepID=A0A915YBT5_9BACT|nr:S8 family peptidase [Aureispira anguillae]BDS10192.1 S8 family peptidase [Aureispira anguillae]
MKYILLLFLGLSIQLVAQQSSKLNIDLHLALKKHTTIEYSTVFLPVLVKGDLAVIEQLVKEDGGYYKYGVKNIASTYISLATIEKLLGANKVERLEYREAVAQQLSYPEDTLMLTHNNVWEAHSGGGLLPQGFKGDGVLLGVIDDGFEWKHPDFMHPDSSTRILYLWDQMTNSTSYPELYYGYGSSWDKAVIDNHQCTHVPGQHGSHVMGTAGGNGRASGKYLGIAPHADLACVKVSLGNQFLSKFVDAVHYIFSKADVLGQACVINSSVGSYASGHDGKDLYSELIDNMLMAKSGRALVQAGGNARSYPVHLGVDLNNSLSQTRFEYHNSKQKMHFDLYADTANFSAVDFSFQLINPQTQQIIAQTATYNILQDFAFTGSIATLSQVLFTDAGGNPVTLEINVDQYEDAYEVAINIHSASNLGQWQLTTTGTGKYDIWSHAVLLKTSNMLENVSIPNYKNPDNIQSIVGYWTCSDKVVTVGSYQNRTHIVSWLGDTLNIGTSGFPQNGISAFSSLGPTRTGLQKPNITAPGGQVMSASPLSTLNYYKSSPNNRLDQDGWHILNRGTSMSAPMVAGAVALYFQCKPYANYADVLQALENSARIDSFVFLEVMALPNIHWGYGKLDVYKLLERCLIYGCMDSTALNYNSLATVSDSNACLYNLTHLNRVEGQLSLSCQPNPFAKTATIFYELPNFIQEERPKLSLYNSLGQLVFLKALSKSKGSIVLEGSNLGAGVYWMVLDDNRRQYIYQQLVINNE